jgi:hypothetical protein
MRSSNSAQVAGPRAKPALHSRKRRARKKGPQPDTLAARLAISTELEKARRRGLHDLQPKDFPTLAELLAHAENAALRRRGRTFHYRGTKYVWAESILGRLSVFSEDGRGIVCGEPLCLFETS